MSIQEQEFQLFIGSLKHYFTQTCGRSPEFHPPYILDESLPLCDFTGTIDVSGDYSGSVYFTANAQLLADLLGFMGETKQDEAMLTDAIGEVANTLAGNFRRDYGSRFIISTPTVRRSTNKAFKPTQAQTTYVVPLNLQGQEAHLIVAMHAQRGGTGAH